MLTSQALQKTTFLVNLLSFRQSGHVGGIPGQTSYVDDPNDAGYTVSLPKNDPDHQHLTAKTAICSGSFGIRWLGEIHCDSLGDYDSWKMEAFSATIAHEMLHIAALISRIPCGDDLAYFGTQRGNIDDYVRDSSDHTSEPEDGYGPYNCWALRQHNNNWAVGTLNALPLR